MAAWVFEWKEFSITEPVIFAVELCFITEFAVSIFPCTSALFRKRTDFVE